MHLSCRMTRVLFEASESCGVPRAELVRGTGLDAAFLSDPSNATDWATLLVVLQNLSRAVGDDPDRLREVGRRMMREREYAPLRAVGRNMVSARAVYELGFRWVAPASFPHLVAKLTFDGDERLHFEGVIPEGHAASSAFLYVSSGAIAAVPEMIGLPPARVLASRITPRTIDLELAMPSSTSLLARARRRARSLLRTAEMLEMLERQREELGGAMESLRKARDELRVVLDRLPDVVVVHNQGTIVWANRALLRIVGYEHVDQIVGKRLLDYIEERSHAVTARRMGAPLHTPEAQKTVEVWVRAAGGREVLLEIAPPQEVVFDGIACRLVAARDITDRVAMQQRLLTADRLSSIGLLAAGVAHEINNPLAYVLVNIEMARKDLAAVGSPLERARHALDIALEGVDRMRGIVRDLLVLSRGEKVTLVPTDVAAVVDSTLALAGEEIRKKGSLVREVEPAPLACASDARVAQVVVNLVSNALQALPPGREAENVLVVRTRPAEGGWVVLEVQDNGIGIPPEHLARVFEPFFTSNADGSGTGLGLAITQRLVVDLGGEIHVMSPRGGGTLVRVLFPAAPDVGETPRAPSVADLG